MISKQKLFGYYMELSVKERVLYMLTNYKHRAYYEESQRQYIEGMIADIRAYERKRNDDLGIRIMSGGSMSDITSAAAFYAYTIKKESADERGNNRKIMRNTGLQRWRYYGI